MKFILVYGKAGALFAGASLLALSGALPARADYQSTVLSQNPVAYWRLNETTPPPVPPILAANAGSVGAGGNGTYNNRKSTRLNSSHGYISYAVFCLKKKKTATL